MTVLRPVSVQLSAAVSNTGASYNCDFRWADHQERLLVVGSLTAGDTIALCGSMDNSFFATIATSISILTRTTIIPGQWPYLRVDKVANNGTATVLLVI